MYARPNLVEVGQALNVVLGAVPEREPDRVNGDPFLLKYTSDGVIGPLDPNGDLPPKP